MRDTVGPRPELRMQQQALVQLIIAGFLMGALCVGAAFYYSTGIGHRSVRSVAPVLGAFMRAGAEGSVFNGHRLLSIQGMSDTTRDELAAVFRQRELFEGFDRVRVTTFRIDPVEYEGETESAYVKATVYYKQRAPVLLEARVEYEPSGWHIRSFRFDGGDS